MESTREAVLAQVPSFKAQPTPTVMICIHPRKDGLSSDEVYRLVEALNRALPAVNLMALGGHPEDSLNIDGLYTRREPYPNIQLITSWTWESGPTKRSRTLGYYDRWTESNFRDVPAGTPDWPRPWPMGGS